MIKFSVVSKNDIWKYIFKFLIAIIILFLTIKLCKYFKLNLKKSSVNSEQCISYITDEITEMNNKNLENFSKIKPEVILESELKFPQLLNENNVNKIENSVNQQNVKKENIQNESEDKSTENQLQVNNIDVQKDEQNIVEVNANAKTEEVVSKYKNTYNYDKDGIKIKNETDFNLNNLNLSTNVKINNKNILIFHTHTCESYTRNKGKSICFNRKF